METKGLTDGMNQSLSETVRDSNFTEALVRRLKKQAEDLRIQQNLVPYAENTEQAIVLLETKKARPITADDITKANNDGYAKGREHASEELDFQYITPLLCALKELYHTTSLVRLRAGGHAPLLKKFDEWDKNTEAMRLSEGVISGIPSWRGAGFEKVFQAITTRQRHLDKLKAVLLKIQTHSGFDENNCAMKPYDVLCQCQRWAEEALKEVE